MGGWEGGLGVVGRIARVGEWVGGRVVGGRLGGVVSGWVCGWMLK